MTKENFGLSNLGEQRRLLLECGAYLGHRRHDDWSVLLYAVDSFYVEVFFTADTLDIDTIEAFDDLDRLEPYLERISLEQISECL